MIKLVPVSSIMEDTSFPYDFRNWNYPDSLLRSTLFAPDDPSLCEDGFALIMDYDGFMEFFPKWNHMYSDLDPDNPPFYADDEAGEYLSYHIGRTVTPVKEVIK